MKHLIYWDMTWSSVHLSVTGWKTIIDFFSCKSLRHEGIIAVLQTSMLAHISERSSSFYQVHIWGNKSASNHVMEWKWATDKSSHYLKQSSLHSVMHKCMSPNQSELQCSKYQFSLVFVKQQIFMDITCGWSRTTLSQVFPLGEYNIKLNRSSNIEALQYRVFWTHPL